MYRSLSLALRKRNIETEKIEKPKADTIPNIKPTIEPLLLFPKANIDIPIAAIKIAIQTLIVIFSFKNLHRFIRKVWSNNHFNKLFHN